MTEDDLSQIESELGIALPATYRRVMLAFPIRACVGNDDTELWDNPSRLIEENQLLRAGAPGGVPPWPAHFFCLGSAGSACVHAIDLADANGAVWWIDHCYLDAPSSGVVSPSFAEWSEQYIATLRGDLESDGIDPDGTPEAADAVREMQARHSRWLLLGPLILLIAVGAALALAWVIRLALRS